MDPSQIREALAYCIFRNGGVPAGRTAFGKVFITVPGKYDKAYAALYTIVEQVDERFVKGRFGTKLGLLLKPEQLAGLPYSGDEWAPYTNRVRAKTAVTSREAYRFIEFVNCLNFADDARFQAAAGDYVDVDEFLRFLALEALLSNMDSPLMTSQNYHLYLHPTTRKLVWLPWDLNEALGGFVPGGSTSEQMDLNLEAVPDPPACRLGLLGEGSHPRRSWRSSTRRGGQRSVAQPVQIGSHQRARSRSWAKTKIAAPGCNDSACRGAVDLCQRVVRPLTEGEALGHR